MRSDRQPTVSRGKPVAGERKFRAKRRPLRVTALVVFPLMLLIPSMALYCLARDFLGCIVPVYLASISGATYYLYWYDKRCAQEGKWRIQESLLHLVELAGGWPAAFVAQRQFRHKISKSAYQVVFWMIGLIHQYLAADYMTGWIFSKGIWRAVFPTS